MTKWESINDITFDDILEHCQKHKETEWLKEYALQEGLTNKNGQPRKVSFIEIRNEFCRKFAPELAPKPAVKKPSMYDIIRGL